MSNRHREHHDVIDYHMKKHKQRKGRNRGYNRMDWIGFENGSISVEEYMLAQFYLIMRGPVGKEECETLSKEAHDVDWMADWKLIEAVRFPTQKEIACPICLERPVCAKITKCGHIFCFSCMLHFFSIEEDPPKSWKKCPLCSYSVVFEDLKSVVIEEKRTFKVGDVISFDLMKRAKDSLFHYRVKNVHPPNCKVFPIAGQKDSSLSRYNVTYNLNSMLNRELQENKKALERSTSQSEAFYFREADKLIRRRIKDWNKWQNKNMKNSIDKANLVDVSPDNSSKNNYYYYQSEDGQNYFLHYVNHRMMMQDSKDFASMKPKLDGTIVAIDTIYLDEENKKRFKYLNNLPYRSIVHFVEVDMQPHVSKEVFSKFEKTIQQRKNDRLSKKFRDLKEQENIKKRKEEADRIFEAQLRSSFAHHAPDPLPKESDFVPLTSSVNNQHVNSSSSVNNVKSISQWQNYRKTKHEQIFGYDLTEIPSTNVPQDRSAWGRKPTEKVQNDWPEIFPKKSSRRNNRKRKK